MSKFRNPLKTIFVGALTALPALAQIPTGVTYEVIYDATQVSFNHPTFVGPVPGDPNQIIVIERPGAVWRLVKNGALFEKKAWFSVAANVSTHWDGAWSLVFHPRFAQNRLFYFLYRMQGTDTRSVIEEWTCNADFTNPRKVRNLIFFNQKTIDSSGDMKFGPDGFLYSAQGDRDMKADGGQLMTEMWGKVIRIDVDRKDAGLEYAIPADNPFRTQSGTRPEIWASGFRVPYRISFDKLNGDLYLGDVGATTAEEVNIVQAGKNYGAGKVEGTCKTDCTGLTDPAANLPPGCVIGGVVYRGDPASPFYGAYIFADYQNSKLSAFKLNAAKTGITDHKTTIANTPPARISAMGEDAAGNIYVATYLELPETSRTHVFRLKHAELRPTVVAAGPPASRPASLSGADLASGRWEVRALDGSRLSPAAGKARGGLVLLRDARTGELRKQVRLP